VKVGLVSPYDFASPGGVTDHVRHLARQLRRLDHAVRIFAPSSRADVDFDTAEFYRIGSPIAVPVNESVARITLSFHLADRVAAIVEREHFDVLHFHEPLMPALPMTLLRMSQAANVGTFHAFAKSNIGYHYGRPLLEPYLAQLHRGIAVSEPAKAFVHRYFPDFPLQVIPNGIDISTFHPGQTPIRHLRDDRVNILFVGRFEERKGLTHLLQAYHRLRKRHVDARLLIIGSGPKQREYQRFVGLRQIRDVMFLGRVSDDAKARYFASADIFCAPATGQESFGIVLLEAMAAGVPIVASDIHGYKNVVQRGIQGLLVEPKNHRALAAALYRLSNDEELRHRMGEEGRAKAPEYAWDRVSEQIVDFYREVREQAATAPGGPR